MSCAPCPCLLVDDACMRQHTGLPVTVSYDAVAVSLRDAQDSSLEYLLGETCAEELCSRYQANTLTDADRDLLACVQPWLAWLAYSIWLRSSGTVVSASGASVAKAETGSLPVITDAAGVAIEDARRRAERFRQQALNLLADNPTLYPCYKLRCGHATPPPIVVR